MPVRIKTKDRFQSSVTPTDLNIETDIINLADQTDDYIIEGQVDLSALQSGDTVILRTYIAVDGVNQRKSDKMTFSGVQDIPIVRVLAHTIAYNGKFLVTITQTAGTLRSFPYTFILQLMEVI
jgi:hypothetical protein